MRIGEDLTVTNDEILDMLATLPEHQRQITMAVLDQAGTLRVCWICGDEAEERHINNKRGFFCNDCFEIQTTMPDGFFLH